MTTIFLGLEIRPSYVLTTVRGATEKDSASMWLKSFKEFSFAPLQGSVGSDGIIRIKHDVRSQALWHTRAAFPQWEIKLESVKLESRRRS
jgi:hypothetical protein